MKGTGGVKVRKSSATCVVILLILLTGCVSETFRNYVNGAESALDGDDITSSDDEMVLDKTEADITNESECLYVQPTQTPRVRINWEHIEISYDDQKPIIINNHYMVPLHIVMEALGFLVEWEEETQTITLTNQWRTVSIEIGNYYMSINNNVVSLNAPVVVINNHLMIPICAISQATGNEVQWDGRTHTIDIFVFINMTLEQLREMPRTISPPIQTSIDGIELGLPPEKLVSLLDTNSIELIVSMEYQDWETIYAHVENPVRDGRIYNIYDEFSFFFVTEDIIFNYSDDGLMEFMHVLSTHHRTSADISIGNSRSKVIDAHGDSYAISPFFSNTIEYFDGQNYLFFSFDFNENVESWGIGQISIFELHAESHL